MENSLSSNSKQIKNSLRAMQQVFAGIDTYRVIGSILVAAINNKPHRILHDIDLLIDERVYEEVANRFNKLGFMKITKRAPGFIWNEFTKDKCLSFGVLLKGKFNQECFTYKLNKYMTLYISNEYLIPTDYVLFGEKIRGIPLRSIYEGIKISSLNKKRKVDKQIIVDKVGNTLPNGPSLNEAFTIKAFGINIPYLYTVFSHIYNAIGGARLAIGKPYDPWN